MENPLVSVMMPVYNGLPLIKASVKSLINQTYSNWECIIIDDGSTDGTGEYIDSLSDKRFVVHHFSLNQGRPAARQKALDMATGKYLAMLDAGDLYHPEKLEKQVSIMENDDDIALVATKMCSFGTNTDIIRVRMNACSGVQSFHGNNVPCHATCLLRTEKAKNYKYNPLLKTGQDVDFLERYLNGEKFFVIDNAYYYYSEFDSTTKRKIRKTYYLYIKKYYKQQKYGFSFIYMFKYLISVILFPFIPIETILKKRGKALSNEEKKEYIANCLEIVNSIHKD